MKRILSIIIIAMMCSCIDVIATASQPQPVTAYKTTDKGDLWTIGIYTSLGQPVSDKVAFKKDTNSISKKSEKLAFDFSKDLNNYNYIYVYRGGSPIEKDRSMVDIYQSMPEKEHLISKFGPITSVMAPPGSKIKLTQFGYEIDSGLIGVTVKKTDATSQKQKWVITSLKTPETVPVEQDIYDTVTISKATTTKKLKVPKGRQFWIYVPRLQGKTLIDQVDKSGVTNTESGILTVINNISKNQTIAIDAHGRATVI